MLLSNPSEFVLRLIFVGEVQLFDAVSVLLRKLVDSGMPASEVNDRVSPHRKLVKRVQAVALSLLFFSLDGTMQGAVVAEAATVLHCGQSPVYRNSALDILVGFAGGLEILLDEWVCLRPEISKHC